jgi:hypothetical protein
MTDTDERELNKYSNRDTSPPVVVEPGVLPMEATCSMCASKWTIESDASDSALHYTEDPNDESIPVFCTCDNLVATIRTVE